jgi:hypothetical protein
MKRSKVDKNKRVERLITDTRGSIFAEPSREVAQIEPFRQCRSSTLVIILDKGASSSLAQSQVPVQWRRRELRKRGTKVQYYLLEDFNKRPVLYVADSTERQEGW